MKSSPSPTSSARACAKALLGKAVLPDDLPWVTGSIGLLGTEPSYELMTECDTLLMIGSGFPYSEFLPKEGQARGVQIDIKPDMLSLRYPMEVNLVGDSAETLRALLPLLQAETGSRLAQDTSKAGRQKWWKTLEDRAMSRRQADQSAARRLGIFAARCPTTRSSPAIPAPAPTGTRAISKSGAA